ncbi:MAG: L-threonylcarbamoyladenylate synthase [Glaciecola sp.]|jgi:L-threonylcarbamoyladenylate synthase
MLNRHYAPSTVAVLVKDISEELKKHNSKRIGVLTFNAALKDDSIVFHIAVSKGKDL